MQDIRLLIILVTYNSEKWIRKNLNVLSSDVAQLTIDIYVVDNGSNDNTVAIIEDEFPQVILYKSSENLGFAKANNLAFEYALTNGYNYVFLMNHDAWLLPGFWNEMYPVLSNIEYKNYGLLSPVHYSSNESDLDFGFEKYAGNELRKSQNETLIEVDMMNGAFLFISNQCLRELKGFDPVFFFYGEDVDFCSRAKNKSYKIGVVTGAKVVHDRKERKMTKERLKHHIYANILLQIKENEGDFKIIFFKAIYSTVKASYKWMKSKDYLRGKLYFLLFFRLISNYFIIKKSFATYD